MSPQVVPQSSQVQPRYPMLCTSSQLMSAFMNVALQLSVPISVATTGTWAATVPAVLSQQVAAAQTLKLYTCHAAARLLSGSDGLYVSHCESALEYSTPPRTITFVAPVARIAFTSSCIPAAWKDCPRQVPPSRQQLHAATVSLLLSG